MGPKPFVYQHVCLYPTSSAGNPLVLCPVHIADSGIIAGQAKFKFQFTRTGVPLRSPIFLWLLSDSSANLDEAFGSIFVASCRCSLHVYLQAEKFKPQAL